MFLIKILFQKYFWENVFLSFKESHCCIKKRLMWDEKYTALSYWIKIKYIQLLS